MSRGLWESLFGLLFSWLPGVGLILSMAGFCRQAVRLTEKHKARRFFSMAFASVVLVAAMSYLTPLLATLVSCWYLEIRATATLWLACAMVIAGAVVCKLSVSEPAGAGGEEGVEPRAPGGL